MTIPKNAGLSRLAGEVFSYPVKKKHQPRRLDPNWGGIIWLEDQAETNTEIAEEYDAGEPMPGGGSEFKIQRALGWYNAKRSMYPSPMFQTFSGFKAHMITYTDPCPACDDWSRTSRCPEHHDRDGVAGLDMEHKRRVARANERAQREQEPFLEHLQRQYEEAARLIRNQELLDPNRWVPDARERVASLADMTIDIEGTFDPGILEITGETVQSASSTVQIEVESNDR